MSICIQHYFSFNKIESCRPTLHGWYMKRLHGSQRHCFRSYSGIKHLPNKQRSPVSWKRWIELMALVSYITTRSSGVSKSILELSKSVKKTTYVIYNFSYKHITFDWNKENFCSCVNWPINASLIFAEITQMSCSSGWSRNRNLCKILYLRNLSPCAKF